MSTSGLARPAQYLKIANATNRRAEFTNPRCLAKFWTSYTGKDKTARVIQYFARFMKWYLRLSNPDSVWASNFDAMSKNVSFARVTFRLFRWMDEWYKFRDTLLSAKTSDPGWLCELINGMFKFGFIAMNNFYFLLVCEKKPSFHATPPLSSPPPSTPLLLLRP
jgi:hypothetical protein|eukprot:COSAG06_NODE_13323_length_1268_cov_1.700599_1_plen_164_part_00